MGRGQGAVVVEMGPALSVKRTALVQMVGRRGWSRVLRVSEGGEGGSLHHCQ